MGENKKKLFENCKKKIYKNGQNGEKLNKNWQENERKKSKKNNKNWENLKKKTG